MSSRSWYGAIVSTKDISHSRFISRSVAALTHRTQQSLPKALTALARLSNLRCGPGRQWPLPLPIARSVLL